MQTALDQISNRNHLQIAKAILPYFPYTQQKSISLFIKFMEIHNILSFYQGHDFPLQATETSEKDIIKILSDIRMYCDESEQKNIDQLLQLLSTLELYSMFLQTSQTPQPE